MELIRIKKEIFGYSTPQPQNTYVIVTPDIVTGLELSVNTENPEYVRYAVHLGGGIGYQATDRESYMAAKLVLESRDA